MATPRPTRALLATAGFVAVLAAACGDDSETSSNTATTGVTADTATTTASTEPPAESGASTDPSSSATSSTLAGVEAALWSDNVTIEVSDTTWRFQSDGVPSHEIADEYLVPTEGQFTPPVTEDEVSPVSSAIAVVESPVDVELPLEPVYSETVTDTNLGIIGVVISGAQLFNDYEDMNREFVALDDNITLDGVSFVDACNGHPLALQSDGTGSGDYHYHGVPYCITDAIDIEDEHSTILGFLLDGFPFYGPQDVNGEIITSDDLDECSGHFGPTPEYPNGIYHYHLTEDRSPYTINCYHGEIESSANGQQGGPPAGEGAGGPGGAPDFTEAANMLGVTTDAITAALGEPPFDLDAAAEALGVNAADLEAALPAPPGGDRTGQGPPAAGGQPPDDGGEPADAADVDAAELDERSQVLSTAAWADSVSITIDGNTPTFESDGLPPTSTSTRTWAMAATASSSPAVSRRTTHGSRSRSYRRRRANRP